MGMGVSVTLHGTLWIMPLEHRKHFVAETYQEEPIMCIQEKKSNIELNFVCIEKKNKVHIFPLFQNDIFFIGDRVNILSKGLSSI